MVKKGQSKHYFSKTPQSFTNSFILVKNPKQSKLDQEISLFDCNNCRKF